MTAPTHTRGSGHRVGQHYTAAAAPDVDPHITTGCRENLTQFAATEQFLAEDIIRLGKDPAGAQGTDAQLISTALAWCERCPIRLGCYQRMSHYKYTGLAGGQLLVRGKDYVPRNARDHEDSPP